MTLGHEVAGVVEKVGPGAVTNLRPGDRVVLHYNITCGDCYFCSTGNEQFCPRGLMLGHFTDGGFAEYISVPARNALVLPAEISFEQGATLMCASATSFHAFRKARIRAGEKAAVFGIGGLGLSAIQLARAFGAVEVFAVDRRREKLDLAAHYGAVPVDASRVDPVEEIRQRTGGRGVDVALEVIGKALTMQQALRSLGPMGRAVIVGIGNEPLSIDTYRELLGGEAELIGPILMGLSKPLHVLQRDAEVNEIVNVTAIAVVDAQEVERREVARV